ncbi:MAG: hypothetical protein WA813_21845, partial [Beijerinckiaceae bacterium]
VTSATMGLGMTPVSLRRSLHYMCSFCLMAALTYAPWVHEPGSTAQVERASSALAMRSAGEG